MSETSTKDTKNQNEGHDKQSLAEKSPILLFLFCTLGSLAASVGAMILILKPKICIPGDETCNFAWLSDEKAGNIGGLFQGSAGVAAAIAGAIVTIILAKIAIDLGRRSNEIAKRQADNDDPIHTKASQIALSRYELIAAINTIQYNFITLINATEAFKKIQIDILLEKYSRDEDLRLNINDKDYVLKKSNLTDEKKAEIIIAEHVKPLASLYSEALTKSMISGIKTDVSSLLISLTPIILQYAANEKSTLGPIWLKSCSGMNFAMENIGSQNLTIRNQALANLFNSAKKIDSIISSKYLGDIINIRKLVSSALLEHNECIPNDVKDNIQNLREQIYNTFGLPNEET